MRYFHLLCHFHKVLLNALQLLKVVILKVDLDVHIKSPFLALQHIAQFCVSWGVPPTHPRSGTAPTGLVIHRSRPQTSSWCRSIHLGGVYRRCRRAFCKTV